MNYEAVLVTQNKNLFINLFNFIPQCTVSAILWNISCLFCLCSPAEKVIWHTGSQCITGLPCLPHHVLPTVPLFWSLGYWRHILVAQSVGVMSLLSCPVYRLNLPWVSSLSFGWSFICCATSSPFCEVIIVKQVFQSQERESENGWACLNGWFPLIPWLNCPFLCTCCIVVHAQIRHHKVAFVWLAGSPQRTNPVELVHSATTSWPGGIGH